MFVRSTIVSLSAVVTFAQALSLNTSSTDSICSAASTVAAGLMDYYEGNKENGTVGYFAGDYYWWEYSQAFHALLDYTFLCDDTQYETLIQEGIVSQLGTNNTFIPEAQVYNIGNDDQSFWGLLAINAHKRGLAEPSDDLSWLAVAEKVFDQIYGRWDPDTCGGGIRWQILEDHSGYNYKNSISNGNLFLLSSQLYAITGDETYYEVAVKVWKWITDIEFVAENSAGVLSVLDGANVDESCEDFSIGEWSYNYGTFLEGLSTLYNATSGNVSTEYNWSNLTQKMLVGVETFFNDDDIMYERTCQLTSTCNEDERCFKSILTRNMAAAAELHTDSADAITEYLVESAKGAAQSCSGGSDGVTCGLNWYYDGWDGEYGIGEQMNALAILVSLL